MKRFNLGCGSTKLDGYINIDIEKSCKPDVVCNFITGQLPYKPGTVDEIVMFHTIEHITKRFHTRVLAETWRVLKPGGRIIISYPEFLKCVKNWRVNHRGKKEFWEATLYGRQLYPSDFHVCIMHTPDFLDTLRDCGFIKCITKPELLEPFNSIVSGVKGNKPIDYEELIKDHVSKLEFRRHKRVK